MGNQANSSGNHSMRFALPTLVLLLACSGFVDSASAEEPEKIRFNEDIRPVLPANRFSGPGCDAQQRKADLRLDTAEGAFAMRDDGAAIKPGDIKHSAVWERITSDEAELVMPPVSSKKKLTPAEKDL